MKVAVTGATGVLGRLVVPTLLEAGHHVVALVRNPQKGSELAARGVDVHLGSIFDADALLGALSGCDAVANVASHTPYGYASALPQAWKVSDRLRTEGVRRVLTAAREAGVRRVVQESMSCLYADGGDEWVTERSPLGINRATEPVSVGESMVEDFRCTSRTGVVLRLGSLVGDDEPTRGRLRAARNGRPIGVGEPDAWTHLLHGDDAGQALLAALDAPSGVYNVGAVPVRRGEIVETFARAVGRDHGDFLGPLMRRVAGTRVEPFSRSLRVSSEAFTRATGWSPTRPEFDRSWLDAVAPASVA